MNAPRLPMRRVVRRAVRKYSTVEQLACGHEIVTTDRRDCATRGCPECAAVRTLEEIRSPAGRVRTSR